jgi:hypothetical protein
MRISFDLDDTLICYGGETPCAPKLPFLLRLFVSDEPLRQGTRELVQTLRGKGHQVWIYTSSGRRRRTVRRWLRLHGVKVDDVVDNAKHCECFGNGSLPTKRPHAFGIDLHVDDSEGVAMEGRQYGFNVCVINPRAVDWGERVLNAVEALERSMFHELVVGDVIPEAWLQGRIEVADAEIQDPSLRDDSQWRELVSQIQPGDELHKFRSPPPRFLSMREGFVLICSGKIRAVVLTMIS